MRLESRRNEFLAFLIVLPPLLGGCGSSSAFRVKTSQPWPDEWVRGTGVPYERLVRFASETVTWHQKANWERLEGQIVALLARRHDLYGFVRYGMAQPQGGNDPTKGLRYLEVKVAPCFFHLEEPAPRVTLDYKKKPFVGAVADLMRRVDRGYVISPNVGDRAPITARLADLDWREATTRIFLDSDVFVEPVWFNPVSLRSYEYATRSEFLEAVRQALRSMRDPAPEAPLTIVPWREWVEGNRAYQLRFHATLQAQPTTQRLGPPSGTALLSSDLAIAKKQILYALPHQIGAKTTQQAPTQ